ncbi:FmdB family transcriptional regulator [bacterium]|nr:FmdB family transcriptional regulator [bacterium]|tara:strand:- start:1828 stop:2088 length:261 start_codon:yes stop_codon:yes gene_type:complete
MPLFNFKCNTCGHIQEFLVSPNQKLEAGCPKCDKPDWEKQFTKRMGVVFKGSGFYVSDNRSSSSSVKNSPAKKPDKKIPSKDSKKK